MNWPSGKAGSFGVGSFCRDRQLMFSKTTFGGYQLRSYLEELILF